MRLLDKKTVESTIRKDNDVLVEKNVRLRTYLSDIIKKINTVKDTFEPEKAKELITFERFCADIHAKKSKLLEELTAIETEIHKKKEIYYGMISQQDALTEKLYELHQQEKRLDLRIGFVEELERKWEEKTNP